MNQWLIVLHLYIQLNSDTQERLVGWGNLLSHSVLLAAFWGSLVTKKCVLWPFMSITKGAKRSFFNTDWIKYID